MRFTEMALIYPNGRVRRIAYQSAEGEMTLPKGETTFDAVAVEPTEEERVEGCVEKFILNPELTLASGDTASFAVTISIS